MQRRDINKRLSFAEAENGQKDRNKEEVEEEREPATEKGINKSEGANAVEGRREKKGEGRRGETAAAPAAAPRLSSPLSLCSTNVPIYYFRGIRPSFRIGELLFPPCAGAGRCTRVSLSEEPPLFRIIGRILEARSSRTGWIARRVNRNYLIEFSVRIYPDIAN